MTHETISIHSQLTIQLRHNLSTRTWHKINFINFNLFSFITIFQFLVSFEIGVIFHDDSNESELAFRYAIKRINMYESGFELEPLIRYASTYDSFKTERIGKRNLLGISFFDRRHLWTISYMTNWISLMNQNIAWKSLVK